MTAPPHAPDREARAASPRLGASDRDAGAERAARHELPPRARLARLANALGKHLPRQLAPLLEAEHFDAEKPALDRLADPEHARAAAECMTEAEAAWLADTLEERWAAIADVELDPIAAIQAPAHVWLGTASACIEISVVVDGVDPDWRPHWEGVGVPDNQREARTLSLELRPDPERALLDLDLHVRIDARQGGERLLLVDRARIALRTPRLVLSENRRQLLIRDQHQNPAARTLITLGGSPRTTDAQGVLQLDPPLAPGTEVRVDGAIAGRLP